MTREKLRIGLFGYGCVGQGLHDVLNSSKGFKADIVRICVKDRTKKRRIPMSNFTFDKNDILNDSSINLVVELIDDADEAFNIVTTAMKSGKNVVTANKMMVAKHFRELVEMQAKYKVSLLYEASAGASIPLSETSRSIMIMNCCILSGEFLTGQQIIFLQRCIMKEFPTEKH